MKKIENFINGSSQSYSKNFMPVYDPSKDEIIAEVVLSDKTDYEKIIQSSIEAFLKWSEVTPLKRSRVLAKYKNLIEKNIT